MVTGRLPTGTTFTILLSNMRLSLGISIPSGAAIGTQILAGSTAPPRKPSLGILFEPRNHDGDVVRAAAFIGECDEFFRRPRWVGLGLKRPRDLGLRDHARQSIGTEQQNIPGKERMFLGVHFDFPLCAKRAQQDALHLTFFSFHAGPTVSH